MKDETKLQRCAKEFMATARKYQLNPEQLRYVSKIARERLGLQIPKRHKSLPDFLNPAEIYRLLEVAKDNPFDALLLEFQIFTGLRIGETNNLLIHQVDFDNDQLKVVEGKGMKDRYVPITTNLQHKLKLYLDGRKTGYVFSRKTGRNYSKRNLQRRIVNRVKMCGFTKKIHTHSLRHTFACLCLARGMMLEKIKVMMGHDSIKTTEIYAKLELGPIKKEFLYLMDQRG